MLKNISFILLSISILFACNKEEEILSYSYQYKLAGTYQRDTSIKSDGYKMLHLKDDGSYCWTRVINGKDSLFCYGKYIQTSDTSLLWEEKQVINFKVTHLDTIFPGAAQLQIFGSPIVPLMYNIY
jgi:hypothetical protein